MLTENLNIFHLAWMINKIDNMIEMSYFNWSLKLILFEEQTNLLSTNYLNNKISVVTRFRSVFNTNMKNIYIWAL